MYDDDDVDIKRGTLVDITGFPNSRIDDPDWQTKAKWEDAMIAVTDRWADLPENMRMDYYISVSYEGTILYSFQCFNVCVPKEFKGCMSFSNKFVVKYT